jgi:hypothetical protein
LLPTPCLKRPCLLGPTYTSKEQQQNHKSKRVEENEQKTAAA